MSPFVAVFRHFASHNYLTQATSFAIDEVKMNIQHDAYVDIQKLIKTIVVYGGKNGNFL